MIPDILHKHSMLIFEIPATILTTTRTTGHCRAPPINQYMTEYLFHHTLLWTDQISRRTCGNLGIQAPAMVTIWLRNNNELAQAHLALDTMLSEDDEQ
jgi:hypothetical protein